MRDHKSLVARQEARAVEALVLRCCRQHWRADAAAVFTQLQRSALSVQLNIAEGHALRTPARFRNHLVIAYGSAIEAVELIELLREHHLVPRELGEPALARAVRTRKLLLGLMRRYGDAEG